ncbi:methyl-accepting chemotaxis sensory transducer [Paraburkholderia sp. BL23I1N1]|uniref:type IV pili methyl-accepting chemotaxis transducer N-terminal domain-containing protein n=1 Tax=Paraburkholderia sp. BL23I1N1 TaxID=1938802 RepID=UPI000E769FF0|nr:type IV pili methyl-accepting chemotaxis transducer N-terminal domain-containing protein [Paraburkholderia sp. BL23I1N1]RKE35969.1 methyl-accepting chemotaxis sensory transducer [Paraburkholderia sp. BL23I1N1]
MSITKDRNQAPPSEADVPSEVLSSLINMAGRQRMLSQRIVLQAMLAFQQFDGAIAIARETLRTFSDSHTALVQGRYGLPGLFSPALREAFRGSENVAQKITGFIALVSVALEAIECASPRANAALNALIGAVDPLLTHLHAVTAVYEQESRRIAHVQKKGQQELIERIKAIAKEAHIVSFNGQIVASRSNVTGREFAVIAGVMTSITKELEAVVSAFVKKTSAG